MAYLHCHTKNCHWSQEDFYSKSYNPFTKIIDDIKWLWKPRMVGWDVGFIEYDLPNLIEYTHIPIKVFKNYRIFSWNMLLLEFVKDVKKGINQKWWTYKSWKKDYDKGKAVCPKCGKINFDID